MIIARGGLAPAVVAGGGGMGHRSSRGSLNIAFPLPGRCPAEPTLLILVFDDSGSMLGGNDSAGMRYEEAGLAVEAVGRRCRCGDERVAVLHMNRPTTADLEPTPISRRNWRDIEAALQVPSDTDGASALADTLQRASAMAQSRSRERACILVFSDYELVDDMHDLAVALTDFPGRAHAVVMRSAPPPIFAEFDQITVSHVPTGEPPGLVAGTVFDALAEPRRPSRRTR